MSDIEEDEFQDAQESFSETTLMDLDTSIADAKKAVQLFFNNDFKGAKKALEPWANVSMYHSLGASVFTFLEALLTFEQAYIEKASDSLKQSINLCAKYRKHNTLTENIGKMVKKTNYDAYTLEEVHAELCYAESLLLKSILAFVEDETLVSFVKAGLKIRTCFLSYKECLAILKSRQWENNSHKLHFESGVRMGIGAFNLMISMLPARIIKLLEFIGFSGDKEYGISELKEGYNERRGIRHVLCGLTLLSYNLIITTGLSYADGDLQWCEDSLNKELSLYPNGVWFLFFKGKLEFTRGNFEQSIEWYTRSWKSQTLWPQFHHICFWELMWVYCCMQQWCESVKFSDMLAKESNWSRTIFYYQKAALLIMQKPEANSEKEQLIDSLLTQAPTFKQRIAGKSLPMEKFIIKRCQKYFTQKKNLILPVYELMYLWNFFKIVSKRREMMLQMFKDIEEAEKHLQKNLKTEFHTDNEALVLLLKGACLREMKHPHQAEECLKRVINLDKSVLEDTHLIPYALVELALLTEDLGNTQQAIKLLEDARKNYTRYHLESRLHFRIHAALMKLNEKHGN